ncbi:MAG TPA: hypothetical protein VF210_04795, partial [Pseudomonadales bacterium]
GLMAYDIVDLDVTFDDGVRRFEWGIDNLDASSERWDFMAAMNPAGTWLTIYIAHEPVLLGWLRADLEVSDPPGRLRFTMTHDFATPLVYVYHDEDQIASTTFSAAVAVPVPEPGGFALVAGTLAGLLAVRRRRAG